MRFYDLTVRSQTGTDKQVRALARPFARRVPRATLTLTRERVRARARLARPQFVMLSRDMPASFRPYHSAAQLAAAEVPVQITAADRAAAAAAMSGVTRALVRTSTDSSLHHPTAVARVRARQPVRVSLETINRLAEEHRQQQLLRHSTDPFGPAFSREQPTRVLASRREDVRRRMAKDAREAREHERAAGLKARPPPPPRPPLAAVLERAASPEARAALASPVPSLLDFKPLPEGASEEEAALERRKQAAMLRLFGEHEYRMREAQAASRAPFRAYLPPAAAGREQERVQLEKDSARLMRKLVLRPRSHTYE